MIFIFSKLRVIFSMGCYVNVLSEAFRTEFFDLFFIKVEKFGLVVLAFC